VFLCRTVRGHGWFFLVKNRLALPVSLGLGGSVLRPLLTSVRTVQGYPRPRAPFGQALLTHYASQTRANRGVNLRCTSSPSILGSVGNDFIVHRQLVSGSRSACMAFLFVASAALAWMRRPGIVGRLTSTSAGFLPTVGRPSAVALA
jgi:hypothetical protein